MRMIYRTMNSSLLLLFLVLISCMGVREKYDYDFTRDLSECEFVARVKDIRQELTTTKNLPEWAGIYYYGDTLGVNIYLELAPNSGYSYEWRGCLGLYNALEGPIKCNDSTISLVVEYPYTNHEPFFLPTALVPIRWGKRYYLVPQEKIEVFKQDIQNGRVRKEGYSSLYLMKTNCANNRGYGDPVKIKISGIGP